MLRPAPAGRIHIAGGTFTMGASPMAMLYGLQLCKREPLGNVLLPMGRSRPDRGSRSKGTEP
jgi:hypothetical protein